VSRKLLLAARPVGEVKPTDFEVVEEDLPAPGEGEFLAEITHLSIDPAMRGWMNEVRSYIEPVGLGEVMRAGALARVLESRHPGYAEGDLVTGMFGIRERVVSSGEGVQKISEVPGASPAAYLGALGMTGLTAYFGLLEVGRMQAGDTVVVSGAAGAVGTVVGQIAKLKGAERVVGIAGGPDKCALLTDELGFDAAVDYRADLMGELRSQTPNGLDVYFDNVGGEVLDAALSRLSRGARVVICGAISQYNSTEGVRGPANYMMLLVARASMAGFLVFDYAERYGEAVKELAGWLASGELRSVEDVVRGHVSDFPEVLNRLFRGQNTGKLVLEVEI
jgi:NADPH-dependent curcumin reductase CurA